MRGVLGFDQHIRSIDNSSISARPRARWLGGLAPSLILLSCMRAGYEDSGGAARDSAARVDRGAMAEGGPGSDAPAWVLPAHPWLEGISGGAEHACARRVSGAVFCWGTNGSGQLGDGTTTTRLAPVPVTGLGEVVEVSVGRLHSCALRASGLVLCWGRNTEGELGDGTTTQQLQPVPVAGLPSDDPAVDVSAGRYCTCVVLQGGRIFCWGENDLGQLGDGTTTGRPTPGPVSGISDGISVSCDMGHCCALRASGAVACWGSNGVGSLGDGTWTDSLVPVAVKGLPAAAVEAVVNKGLSCARFASGQVYCWGANNAGQLGSGSAAASSAVPVAVTGITDALQLVRRGWDYTCALRQQGRVSCWGANDSGQLGDGSTTGRSQPVLVQGLTDAVELGIGHYHACARRAAGKIVCWGMSGGGRLGTGDATTGPQPTPVPSLFLP